MLRSPMLTHPAARQDMSVQIILLGLYQSYDTKIPDLSGKIVRDLRELYISLAHYTAIYITKEFINIVSRLPIDHKKK